MCVLVSSSRATTITSHSCDRLAQLLQGISGTLTCSLSLTLSRASFSSFGPSNLSELAFSLEHGTSNKEVAETGVTLPFAFLFLSPSVSWVVIIVSCKERDRERVRELAEYSIAGGVSLQCKFALLPLLIPFPGLVFLPRVICT